MRHTPTAIRRFLTEQPLSGQTVADFCDKHELKAATFYSWKKKYGELEPSLLAGFCKINTQACSPGTQPTAAERASHLQSVNEQNYWVDKLS